MALEELESARVDLNIIFNMQIWWKILKLDKKLGVSGLLFIIQNKNIAKLVSKIENTYRL